MDENEIESLFVTLGMKTDDPSVEKSITEMIHIIQHKLNSSIYGGEKRCHSSSCNNRRYL